MWRAKEVECERKADSAVSVATALLGIVAVLAVVLAAVAAADAVHVAVAVHPLRLWQPLGAEAGQTGPAGGRELPAVKHSARAGTSTR